MKVVHLAAIGATASVVAASAYFLGPKILAKIRARADGAVPDGKGVQGGAPASTFSTGRPAVVPKPASSSGTLTGKEAYAALGLQLAGTLLNEWSQKGSRAAA